MRILKIFSKTKGQEPKVEIPRKQPLKAKVHDVYFGKLYIDYHHFCRQCEDHFETTGATESNYTPFAALFLYGKIDFWWHQHWRHFGGIFVLWEDFKPFYRKNLGDSRSFVDIIWSNIKWNS